MYGTPPEDHFRPWGAGTDVGRARALGQPEVALRGIALWLAVAYHETKYSGMPSQQRASDELLRELKQMQQATGGGVESWIEADEAA